MPTSDKLSAISIRYTRCHTHKHLTHPEYGNRKMHIDWQPFDSVSIYLNCQDLSWNRRYNKRNYLIDAFPLNAIGHKLKTTKNITNANRLSRNCEMFFLSIQLIFFTFHLIIIYVVFRGEYTNAIDKNQISSL